MGNSRASKTGASSGKSGAAAVARENKGKVVPGLFKRETQAGLYQRSGSGKLVPQTKLTAQRAPHGNSAEAKAATKTNEKLRNKAGGINSQTKANARTAKTITLGGGKAGAAAAATARKKK